MLNIKKITLMCFLAGFLPITAYGTMIYNSSQPCGNCAGGDGTNADGSCLPTYVENDTNRNFQRIYGEPQHQLKKIKKQKTETQIKTASKASPKKTVKSVKDAKSVYLAGRFVWNMWSWDNKYESDYNGANKAYAKDSYSLKSVYGGSVALGVHFTPTVRGDLELGLTESFKDFDDTASFKMSLPYLMANVYRDFDSGFYLGGGIGIAKPRVVLTLALDSLKDGGMWATGNDVKKSTLSPKFGAAVGYATRVIDNVYIDFRYRFSMIKGTDTSENFLWKEYMDDPVYDVFFLQVDTGWIVENSLSIGLRYNF